MPFVGFNCPDRDMWDIGRGKVSADTCLGCACDRNERVCHYSAWLIARSIRADKERDSFSPTTLLGCYRQYSLRRTSAYTVTPLNELPKLRGSMLHEYVERTGDMPDHILREFVVSKPIMVDGTIVDIHGIIDYYNQRTMTMIDYKTVTYLSQILKESNKPEYLQQLSIYRWMIDPMYPVDSAYIEMIDSKTPWRREYKLWKPDRTEEFMRSKIRELRHIYAAKYMPPVIDELDQWRCINCEVREACNQRALDDGEAPPNPEERKEAEAKRKRYGK